MYVPDPIERAEAGAEAAYYDLYQGNGMIKCYMCDNVFPEDEGEILSPDPYAMPACPSCAEKAHQEWEKERQARDVCSSQQCPVGVTHYKGEAPSCTN